MQLRTLTVPVKGLGEGGWLPNDELTRDWIQWMQQYRAECDAADCALGECRGTGGVADVSLFLLDTDHLTLYEMGHPQLLLNFARHLTDQLAIRVISVEEQLTGWQRALSQARNDSRREQIYQRMARTVEILSGWRVLPLSLAAMSRHAQLIRQRLNVGSNDLKIAATALENNAIVVTRNLRDFGRVAGLSCQDWTA